MTLRGIQASRASMASHAVGLAQAATEAAIGYATEAAVRVTSKAIQVHGAYGLTTRHPVERLFRDARMLTFPDGTSEIHRLLVGRSALGLDAFR